MVMTKIELSLSHDGVVSFVKLLSHSLHRIQNAALLLFAFRDRNEFVVEADDRSTLFVDIDLKGAEVIPKAPRLADQSVADDSRLL